MNTKLKYNEISKWRAKALEEQDGICALCNRELPLGAACLDHDHSTGRVRAAVHSDCNILLGKIENFIKRFGKGLNSKRLETFLYKAYDYMQDDYTSNPFHPKHKTPVDRELRKYKRLLKKSKRESTKEKYRKLIQELKDEC